MEDNEISKTNCVLDNSTKKKNKKKNEDTTQQNDDTKMSKDPTNGSPIADPSN